MHKKKLKKLRGKGKVVKRKRPSKDDLVLKVENLTIGKQLDKLLRVLSFTPVEIKQILHTNPQLSTSSILTPELFGQIRPIIESNIDNYLASMPQTKYILSKKNKGKTNNTNYTSNKVAKIIYVGMRCK